MYGRGVFCKYKFETIQEIYLLYSGEVWVRERCDLNEIR